MEPRGWQDPHRLKDLKIEDLCRAVEHYLCLAYPNGQPPEAVRRRLEWMTELDAEAVLSRPPFERAGRATESGAPIFALRLGNSRYPHMKLQIQPWRNVSGFMLSVNTHDQILALDPRTPDA